jgi:class 3 adenylate cyclase
MATTYTIDTMSFVNNAGFLISTSAAAPGRVSISNASDPNIIESWAIDPTTSKKTQFIGTTISSFTNFTTRIYYTTAAALLGPNDTIAWTPPFARATSFAIAAATPIFYPNTSLTSVKSPSQVFGVATGFFDLNTVSSFLKTTSSKAVLLTHVFILDQNGTIIGTSDGLAYYRDANNTLYTITGISSNVSLISDISNSVAAGNTAGEVIDNGITYSWLSTPYRDPYNINWNVVTATQKQAFINTVIQGGVWAIVVSVVLLIAATILIAILMYLISKKLQMLSMKMYRMSMLLFDKSNKKRYSIFAELRLMEKSIEATGRGLQSFAKFVPVDVVRNIMVNKKETACATTGMEQRDMTVMFTDIVDFTNMVEGDESDDLLQVMNEHFTIMTCSIERNGGVIDKFIGDSVMALWNHQKDHDGDVQPMHAKSACNAALESQKALQSLREKCKEKLLPEIFIRIGINTGKALVGNVGSESRLNFTAVGDTVNTSARLESLNKRYGTDLLIGENTFLNHGNDFISFFVDSVKLKGKNKSTTVYHLRKLRNEASPEEIHAEKLLLQAKNELLDGQYNTCVETIENVIQLELENTGYVEMLCARVRNLCDMSHELAAEHVHLVLHEK